MAKQVIVTCDWHVKVVPATTNYELSNGKSGGKKRLDLCKEHERELLLLFARKPATAAEVKKERDRERHRTKYKQQREYTGGSSRNKGTYWADLEHKVMAVANAVKTNIHINDILKGAGITKSSAGSTLRRLVAKELLVTTGGRGRYRRYHLPAE